MTDDPQSGLRAEVAARLWQVAKHKIIAEWICCDPIDPKHQLCVKGDATLRMTKALLVDSPEAWEPAPLLDAVMQLLSTASPAVPVPPTPTTHAVLSDAERTMLAYALDQAQERIWSEDGFTDEDQAAVDSLRRIAAEAQQQQQQPDTETREETGAALARYIADRPVSEIQAAFRILGWPPPRFELVDDEQPAPSPSRCGE